MPSLAPGTALGGVPSRRWPVRHSGAPRRPRRDAASGCALMVIKPASSSSSNRVPGSEALSLLTWLWESEKERLCGWRALSFRVLPVEVRQPWFLSIAPRCSSLRSSWRYGPLAHRRHDVPRTDRSRPMPWSPLPQSMSAPTSPSSSSLPRSRRRNGSSIRRVCPSCHRKSMFAPRSPPEAGPRASWVPRVAPYCSHGFQSRGPRDATE